jgi:hypothetical protein
MEGFTRLGLWSWAFGKPTVDVMRGAPSAGEREGNTV